MRKIFSSQRVENAEGVAQMLRDAGIEVRVTNGRSYRTRRRGQFSYLDKKDESQLPSVWVVRADDQPRAREILRDARLLDTTRRDHPVAEYAFREVPARRDGRGWAWRLRVALLVVIAGVALVVVLRHRGAPPPASPVPAAPVQDPDGDEGFRVRIQPSGTPPPG
ncbi:DUF2007 domain-containing protein [Stenotrophomonas mori]|uniref:DUF2007 domain-containing protein n=1 Tax=Stenotrophomonas mori TaxID=2871096 RepID=A0ABT0SG95_9GAMM|nr:DUF2007 domain-containing protein [Stenotrophomonas mori]MCL7714346.1 DUF2007 domain-containing protein [Stenotrophomonas mori]